MAARSTPCTNVIVLSRSRAVAIDVREGPREAPEIVRRGRRRRRARRSPARSVCRPGLEGRHDRAAEAPPPGGWGGTAPTRRPARSGPRCSRRARRRLVARGRAPGVAELGEPQRVRVARASVPHARRAAPCVALAQKPGASHVTSARGRPATALHQLSAPNAIQSAVRSRGRARRATPQVRSALARRGAGAAAGGSLEHGRPRPPTSETSASTTIGVAGEGTVRGLRPAGEELRPGVGRCRRFAPSSALGA
jgi:hypothetical protein